MKREYSAVRCPRVDVNLPPQLRKLPRRAAPIGRLNPGFEIALSGGGIRHLQTTRIPHAHVTGAIPGKPATAPRLEVEHPDVAIPGHQHATAVTRQARILGRSRGHRFAPSSNAA